MLKQEKVKLLHNRITNMCVLTPPYQEQNLNASKTKHSFQTNFESG